MRSLLKNIATYGKGRQQEPFTCVAPVLRAALLLGAGGGFVLAVILSTALALGMINGSWWLAFVQAHGHLQLYGWAGLFMLGVLLHFMPRLRGSPLFAARLVPWLLGLLVAGLLLRGLSQPMLSLTGSVYWYSALIASGVCEAVGLLGMIALLGLTFVSGPPLVQRPAFNSIAAFILLSLCALVISVLVNLFNMVLAVSSTGIIAATTDDLNVTIGLLGFLVPMALAMSARSLPMYAGLSAFPNRLLQPLMWSYIAGFILLVASVLLHIWSSLLEGCGMLLIGGTLLGFIAIFLHMMRRRGTLPQNVARLAPKADVVARSYKVRVVQEKNAFGPFVALVASAYLWACLGGIFLIIDGIALLSSGQAPVVVDAIRHSLAVGFIALLISGIAPRMLPGFSGGKIVSPVLVHATLWLGNGAAFSRVGALILPPLLALSGLPAQVIEDVLFGLSGPLGLAFAICLAINLWPVLRSKMS